jgi:two-component system sensor histidine kinase YesM
MKMNFITGRFKYNRLFTWMVLIAVLIIIIVSVTITWTTIHMSENFFIEKFSIMNTKVMDKIEGNMETFDNSVVMASDNLLQSSTVRSILTANKSTFDKMEAYYQLGQKIDYIKSFFGNNQVSIFIMGKDGTVYTDGHSNWPIKDETLKNSIIVRNTLKEPKRLVYQFDKQPSAGLFTNENEYYIVASRSLMDRTSGEVYGSMYFAISESQFRTLYSSYTSMGNNVFLVDKKGMIVSSNAANYIGIKDKHLLRYAEEMEQHPQKYILKSFMGKDQIMLVNYIPYLDMYLFNMIDEKEAIGHVINHKAIALIVMGIVVVALIIVFFATRKLTNSLSKLVKQISNAPKHDFHQYVAVEGTYETRQIGQAFNSMLDELHEYVEQLILAQKQKRHAELAALQQQINPHFLYNTLTSIKFMIHQGEKAEMEATIAALISLLQNTLGNVNETVTVKQELDNLRNYVFINQKRYGDQIKVNYFAAPDCLEYPIPKLILQPFVENSFFHGFNHKTEGSIHVLVWKEEESLICEVVDNGDGMEIPPEGKLPDSKRKKQRFSGIGVKNVHERIQLIYGDQYGVTITSQTGEGTKVRVVIPITQI